MPKAARVGDQHTCPAATGTTPHVGGPILGPGVSSVLIENMPAAIANDNCTCAGGPATITPSSSTVVIGGRPAARVGDSTAHGGTITGPGASTVEIG